MNAKKWVLGIIMVVLCIGCIVGNACVFGQTFDASMPKVMAGAAILACLSGLYYTFRGFKKYAAPAYAAYMTLCAVYSMLTTVAAAIQLGSRDSVLLTAIIVAENALTFSCYQILVIQKDLGKARTLTAGCVILGLVLLQLVPAIPFMFTHPELQASTGLVIVTRTVTKLVLAVIAFVMILAKYTDKKERGTR